MTQKRKDKKSLLFSYAASYLMIFSLTFVVIGALLLEYYVNDFVKSYRGMEEYKVAITEQNLDAQLEVVDKVRYKIATTITYHPIYFAESEINKIDMMEQLALYTDTSIFLEEYYLFYLNRGEVYSSSEAMYQYSLLFERVWGLSDSQEIGMQLSELTDITFIKAEKDYLWLCLPIRFYTTSNDSSAILLCRVNEAELMIHTMESVDLPDNKIAVYYDGKLILNTPGYTVEEMAEEKEGFAIAHEFSAANYLTNLSIFQVTNVCILVVAVILLLVVAFYMAYYHFIKIRHVSTKINNKIVYPEKQGKDELKNIEEMFTVVYEQNAYYANRLQLQMKLLKQQLLSSLIAGAWNPKMNTQLDLLQMDMADKQFAVIRLRSNHLSEKEMDNLANSIEELSDSDINYYAQYEEGKQEVVVIMMLVEEDMYEEGVETVRELLLAGDLEVQMYIGTVYGEPDQIVNSYLEASKNEEKLLDEKEAEEDKFSYRNDSVDKIEVAILAGNNEEAKLGFGKLMDRLAENDSLLYQKCMYTEILSMLMQLSDKLNVNLSKQQISSLLTANELPIFATKTEAIIEALCKRVNETQKMDENDTMYAVKEYVKKHFLDYNLTIENIASEFNLSPTYLSRSFKKAAGKNYKEYIIQLKMDYAKELLRKGENVLEVSQKVGYANVSHFIKLFKRQVDMTPSAYQNEEFTDKLSE